MHASPKRIELYLGRGASCGLPTLIVWEGDHVLVIETDFPIARHEHLRIDCGADVPSRWGTVIDGRAGVRAEDFVDRSFVHWVQLH